MEIGNEISQKIRSAIKAKLIELGAYVDDELPDYIMVMVANKKTQKQMSNDLSLFLSHNTDTFTAWLHNLLKKLQSINTGAESSTSKHKSKEKHKGEKRKHRTSQSEKPGKSGEPEKKKAVTEKTAAKSGESPETEEKKDAVSAKSTEEKVPATHPTDDEPGTEINISENTDEFNEENKEIEKNSDSIKSSSTGKPPPAKVSRSKKSSDEAAGPSIVPARRHSASKSGAATTTSTSEKHSVKVSSESRKKPSSFVVAVKRRYEEEDEVDEEYDPANPAVGSVASVIRGPTRKSSVPKSLQANRSLLMKAVSDAEKSVTTAKKTDFLEKEESKMQSDRKPVDLSRRLKTAAGLQLISRSKRKELEKMKYTVSNTAVKEPAKRRRSSGDDQGRMQFTVKNESVKTAKISPKQKNPAVASSRMAASAIKDISKQTQKVTPVEIKREVSPEEDGSEQNDDDDEQYGPPLPDTRLVQHSHLDAGLDYEEDSQGPTRSESPSDNVTDPEIQRILDESNNLTEEAEYLFEEEEDTKRIIKNRPSPPTVDPKFIVTLDGVDPSAYPVTPDPLAYPVIPDVKESIIQTVKPVRTEAIKPERPMVVVEPELSLSAKMAPPKIKPFNINLKDTDDEEDTEESMDTTETEQTNAIQERCRFWPACANGSACQYIHPSIPCKTFPYCKFGEKCMYIHPNCKFDAKCSRPDCPFTHATKRQSYAPTVIHKVVQVPMQPFMPAAVPRPIGMKQAAGNMCKFYPNCKNMNCPFMHPKPCRYGIGCMNKATCIFQHPALPDKDKLTWSASTKKDNTQKPATTNRSKSTESAK